MKKLTIFLIFVFLFTVFIMPAHSGLKKTGQTGLQFLKVDMSARAAAMGGAFGMIGNDASALFYNPAGIAHSQLDGDVFVTRTEWIADISYIAGGLVQNLGNLGKVGFSFVTCDYGDIIGTRVTSTEKGYVDTGNLDVGAFAIGMAYARQWTDKFTIGGQIKYASQRLGANLLADGGIAENKVSGTAYDFGTIFYPGFKSFRMGMNIRNFSEQLKYQETSFQLPLTFVISFAMDVLDFMGEEHENNLLIAVDAIHPRDYTERIHLGSEYWFMNNMVALRAGYKFNYDLEGISLGFGFKKSISGLDVKLDYSYSDVDIFDAVNRISLGVSF